MNIKIYLDRYTETCNVAGTQYEQNATTIKLDFSELDFIDDECVKTIHFFHDDLSEENYIGDSIIENDEFKIPKSITEYENVLAFIQITKEDFIWKTKSFNLDFFTSLDVDKTLDEDQLGILQGLILEVQQIKTDTADEYKQLAEEETKKFNDNVTSKTTEFNNIATSKTESFNSNATSKETSYNENATSKLNEYNENHTSKLNAYNENAAEKIAEYDEHIEELDNIVSKNVANGESILIDDALKYKIFGAKVDGNASQITTTGKNLLSKKLNEYSKTTDYITVDEASDNLLKLSVNSESTSYENVQILSISVESNKTYTLSAKIDGDNNSSIRVVKNNSGAAADNLGSAKNGQPFTFTCDGTYSHIGLFFYVSEGVKPSSNMTTSFSNVQLEEGSVATDYELYTGGEVSPNPDYPQDIEVINGNVKIINCGKNLITKQGLSTSLSENDYYDSRTTFLTPGSGGWGHLECDNSSGTSSKYINIFVKKKNIYVKENSKYTLFVELKNVSNLSYLTVNQVIKDDLFQESRGINTGESVSDGIYKFYLTTKEVLSDDMILRIYTGVSAGKITSFDMRVMILENNWTDKEVEYEAFQSNEYTIDLQDNELVKLYDKAQDVIEIDKSGNVSLNKKIGKVVLDENTNPTIASQNYQGLFFFSLSALEMNVNSLKAISDYFTFVDDTRITDNASANTYLNYGQFAFRHGTTDRIYFKIENIVTGTDFKSWLADHNVTVYYELAESTTSNLETIANFKTYAGVNYFFLEANLATNFEIKYAQDLQKVISKQQVEIDELKTLFSSTATSALLLDNYESDLINEIESEVEQ